MPDTRPGIKFNEDGICYPCLAYEHRKNIDWHQRRRELEQLADRYRGCNGDFYDCINAVSSGKDSHYQTYILKEELGMNPLLVSVDNFSWTDTGRMNWDNIRTRFGVDALMMSLNPKVCKLMFRKSLVKLGAPTWYFDKAIYAFPLRIAIKFGIQLIMYGENVNYEKGGADTEETPCALSLMDNDVVKPVPWDEWLDEDVTMKDVQFAIYPSRQDIETAGLDPIYLSYYIPWSSYGNWQFANPLGSKVSTIPANGTGTVFPNSTTRSIPLDTSYTHGSNF